MNVSKEEMTFLKVVGGWVLTILGWAYLTGKTKADMEARIKKNQAATEATEAKVVRLRAEVEARFEQEHSDLLSAISDIKSILITDDKELRFVSIKNLPAIQASCQDLMDQRFKHLAKEIATVVSVVEAFRERDSKARTRRDD